MPKFQNKNDFLFFTELGWNISYSHLQEKRERELVHVSVDWVVLYSKYSLIACFIALMPQYNKFTD